MRSYPALRRELVNKLLTVVEINRKAAGEARKLEDLCPVTRPVLSLSSRPGMVDRAT